MKTPLGDLEIQNVIDLLLTRQTGSSSSNYHDWIDASGQKNETKILSNQLEEKCILFRQLIWQNFCLVCLTRGVNSVMIIAAGRPRLSGQQKINHIFDLKIA